MHYSQYEADVKRVRIMLKLVQNPSLSAKSSENSLLFLFLVDTVCNPTTSSATAMPFTPPSLRADKNSSVGGVKQGNYPNKKDPQDFAGRVVK